MGDYRENAEYVKKILDGGNGQCKMEDFGDRVAFSSGIGGFKGIYSYFKFILVVQENEVQCYSPFPLSANGKLPEMAEFLMRANYGLTFGAFEMDYNDGEIRYHFALPMSAIKADNKLLSVLMTLPAEMLHRYSVGITEVLVGSKSPEEAVKACESEVQ